MVSLVVGLWCTCGDTQRDTLRWLCVYYCVFSFVFSIMGTLLIKLIWPLPCVLLLVWLCVALCGSVCGSAWAVCGYIKSKACEPMRGLCAYIKTKPKKQTLSHTRKNKKEFTHVCKGYTIPLYIQGKNLYTPTLCGFYGSFALTYGGNSASR